MHNRPDSAFLLEALRTEAAALRAAAAAGDPTADVPTCPGWTLEDLLRHLVRVFDRIAGRTTGTAATSGASDVGVQDELSGAAVFEAYDAGLERLTAMLANLDQDTEVASGWAGSRPGWFWQRRAAVEMAIHRWDAQAASGTTTPIGARLASYGVDEVFDALLPAGRRAGPDDLEGVVRLAATDAGTRWVVRIRGAAFSLLDTNTMLDPGPGAQAAADGSASDLLLALWGRIPISALKVTGNANLVDAVRTN